MSGASIEGASLHCFTVERDATDGTVSDIDGTSSKQVYELDYLDVSFADGPDGLNFYSLYGSSMIGQGTFDFGATSSTNDTAFTEGHLAHTRKMTFPRGDWRHTYGLAFSPIAIDNSTGHGLLFATGDLELLTIPLHSNGNGYYDVTWPDIEEMAILDDENAHHTVQPGDIRFFESGENYQDLLFVDSNSNEVQIIRMGDNGYPIGVTDSGEEVEYVPGSGNTIASLKKSVILKTSEEKIKPIGMDFDPITNDYFISFYDYTGNGSGFVAQVRGFPPGYDPATTATSTENAADSLFDIASRRQRRLRGPETPPETCGVAVGHGTCLNSF